MDADEEDAFVYIYDRRSRDSLKKQKIHIGGVFSFDVFLEKICDKFSISPAEEFIVTTTGRNIVCDDDTFVTLIESGDTLYLLKYISQPLDTPVAERIEFQPHYDTLIKSGIYEYYASEGNINPLPFAFAELIDNALAATVNNRGTRIIELSLHISESSGRHGLCVYDNGEGMSSRQLNNWAIYRLSKFNRKERHERVYLNDDARNDEAGHAKLSEASASKSLNSDISWFGVGGKQAIFFIGNATRIITKPRGSCDVHEFTMSKDEFRRKERNREAIFSGYIRNRKPKDATHVPRSDSMTRKFVASEGDDGFTRVIVTGISPSHVNFVKRGFNIWTRQLAHIYHYYIHGPEGNTAMSRRRKNVGAMDVNIKVSLHEEGKETISINLGEIEDDLESRYIRTASDSFEFRARADGGCVEGVLRYHPFLYDRETYPLNQADDDDEDDVSNEGGPPARGRRPVFECFWNGRLIPYTFVDDFDWCRLPKKQTTTIPFDCYYRVSGCLFSNDKFQVSTNKLTFIDLDAKLRDRNTTFSRYILGQEQRGQIHRQFIEWIKDCHEKYDKQVKFFKFSSKIMRADSGPRKTQTPWTVYKAIEWNGKVFSKGHVVRTQRTNPVICGTIRRFLLCGDYDGDVYAVGGEMEIVQEPQSLYNEVRSFPLSKLDRSVTAKAVKEIIEEEESRLPAVINLKWPDGGQVKEGQSTQAGLTIGAMSVHILDRNDDQMQQMPSSGPPRKLLMEQRLLFTPPDGDENNRVELSSHVATHGRSHPYLFKPIENLKDIGRYTIVLQAALADTGAHTFTEGHRLPSLSINFKIKEAPPYKFMVGILESPLRVGEPFDIPLDMQDKFGHSTPASTEYKPTLQSTGLELSYEGVETKGNTLIIKDVTAIGTVSSQHGKNFSMTVVLSGLNRPSQTLKIRLLPGAPHAVKLASFNDGSGELVIDHDHLEPIGFENASDLTLKVEVEDVAGNVTVQPKLVVQCKFTGSSGLPTWTCSCAQNGLGVLTGKVRLKKVNNPVSIKAKIELQGAKHVKSSEYKFVVQPSTKIRSIEVFQKRKETDGGDDAPIKLKQGQDIYWEAGEVVTCLTFRLLDEAKREVELNSRLASHVKVNWTGDLSTSEVEDGCLPDVTVPTNVSDVKFCQVTYAGEKNLEFSFSIKPVAGEPAGLKVTVHGDRTVRLGLVRREPISIVLLDSFGNQLHIMPGQLDKVRVSADGLDETLLCKTVESNRVVVSDIQFNEGPLGGRELTVRYGDEIREYAVLQLIAGSPVTLRVTGWPDMEKTVSVLSGMRLQEEVTVQLLDGWGNPSPESGAKVLLGKDPSLKLIPAPSLLKTDADGSAAFPKFAVSGKCGDYFLQPRVVYNRIAIEGPKLSLCVLPNTETPVSFDVNCLTKKMIVEAGDMLPGFEVNVLSEEGSNVTASVHLCMLIWKGKPPKDKSIPSNAEWRRALAPQGAYIFEDVRAATVASDYNIMFGTAPFNNSKHLTLTSECYSVKVIPGRVGFNRRVCILSLANLGERPVPSVKRTHPSIGRPHSLVPTTAPGTPTVSNAKVSFNRVLIRSLKLQVKDQHGNLIGSKLDGTVAVTIQPCDQSLKSSEVPKFEGKSSKLNVALRKGEINLQNLSLEENSPGCDGAQYVLHCEVITPALAIEPFMLKFLFFNDAKKHAEISALAHQRDSLVHAVKAYKETFDAHESLLKEMRQSVTTCVKKKDKIVSELTKQGVAVNKTSDAEKVDQICAELEEERDSILQQPRRQCTLREYPDSGGETILGKIGHLAQVDDDDIARVLSWHLGGDMDCLITHTTKKAREIHRVTNGAQQLLPLDSIYRKGVTEWNKPLPHLRAGIKSKNIPGNPVYARKMLNFSKEEENCKLVFGMLLGDTLILNDLDSANEYRKLVVKHTHCPTILTRTGDRVRGNGKFGGFQNRAPTIERLGGAVFGAPIPQSYAKCCKRLETLTALKSSLVECDNAREDLELLELSMDTDEMSKKKQELLEAQERLKEIERQIGLHKPSRSSSGTKRDADEGRPPRKKLRR